MLSLVCLLLAVTIRALLLGGVRGLPLQPVDGSHGAADYDPEDFYYDSPENAGLTRSAGESSATDFDNIVSERPQQETMDVTDSRSKRFFSILSPSERLRALYFRSKPKPLGGQLTKIPYGLPANVNARLPPAFSKMSIPVASLKHPAYTNLRNPNKTEYPVHLLKALSNDVMPFGIE